MSEQPRDPWYEWRDAFAAACARLCRQFEAENETSSYIAPYITLIERLLRSEPERPEDEALAELGANDAG